MKTTLNIETVRAAMVSFCERESAASWFDAVRASDARFAYFVAQEMGLENPSHADQVAVREAIAACSVSFIDDIE